ncbi:MAG: DMT family transporter [Gammaproteobacteria bacterium]|nr:DMT family transporter [Gammaproteobacteria bacterium]
MLLALRRFERNDVLFGIVCVALATLGLSLKAIFIKLVYLVDPHIDAVSMLAIRFVLALPFFILCLIYFGDRTAKQTFPYINTFQIGLLGIAGYYLSAILDFAALKHIPAGVERLILFLYPSFVVLIAHVTGRGKITRATSFALLLSYTGMVAVFAEQIPALNSEIFLGCAMVLGAAIVFAVYTVASVSPIKRLGSVRFTVYASIAATIVTLVHAISIHGFAVFDYSIEVYALVLPMSVFSTVLPLLFMAEGIKRIGATSASLISMAGPVITLGIAYFILQERIGILQSIGGVLIISGVYLAASRKKSPA